MQNKSKPKPLNAYIVRYTYKNKPIHLAIRSNNTIWFFIKDFKQIINPMHLNKFEQTLFRHEIKHGIGSDGVSVPVVNISGLYRLLFKDNSKKVRKFVRYLTDIIIPSIDIK